MHSDILRERVTAEVVGRTRELELLLAATATGRDVVLEGPPGTSKTTMLKALTGAWNIPLVLIEGNAELTPPKLLGYYDPAHVMRDGYTPDAFNDGPLLEAMRSGGFLYIEEFNRAPDDTLNLLLTAIADRMVAIPRLGVVRASESFRVIGSMNPYDNVGTTRLSMSIRDRLCRISVGYQDAASERAIVERRTGLEDAGHGQGHVVEDAVSLTRATRSHPDLRQGSSVRGAIDLALIADYLIRDRSDRGEKDYKAAILDAMLVALSGRLLIDESSGATPESILREIWDEYFILDGAIAAPG
jgi:MoxR-like ATPase